MITSANFRNKTQSAASRAQSKLITLHDNEIIENKGKFQAKNFSTRQFESF